MAVWSSVIADTSSSSSIPGHPSSLPSACQRLEEVVQRLEEEKGKRRRKSITEDEEEDESSSLAGFLDSPEGEYFSIPRKLMNDDQVEEYFEWENELGLLFLIFTPKAIYDHIVLINNAC